MAEVREMTIPLRAAWSVPRTRRANRAMAQIKKHVSQHMKKTEEEEIWIDESVNHVSLVSWYAKPAKKNSCSSYQRGRFSSRSKIVGGLKNGQYQTIIH